MSRLRETIKDDESGTKNPKISQKRKKGDPEYDKDSGVMSKNRLPLIGSSGNRTLANTAHAKTRPSLSTPRRPPQATPRKRVSSGAPDSMAPWEGSSQSESSFTSFPPPLSPPPPAHSKPAPPADPPPPHKITHPHPHPVQSAPVKRRLVPLHLPPRPPRLPPLRQISNLSFSRSFTFSFFELPVHQSARSRAERLRELTLLLRRLQY